MAAPPQSADSTTLFHHADTVKPGGLFVGRPKGWLPYGDIIRAAGALAVVLAHVSQEATADMRLLDTPQWWFAACLDAAGRWAVPCFLMLSGAIFLSTGHDDPTRLFYRKRLARLGVPMGFWLVFYLFWNVWFWQEPLTFQDSARLLLSGATAIHLHFLAVIMGLYLFTPMLRIYIHHAPPHQLLAVAGAVLMLSLLSGGVEALHGRDTLKTANVFNRFVPYLGYYLLGHALRHVTLQRLQLLVAWMVFIAGVVATAVGTRWLLAVATPDQGALYLYSQVSPTRAVVSVAAFLIIATHFTPSAQHSAGDQDAASPSALRKFRLWIARWIAPASLGLYVIHIVFMDLFYNAGIVTTQPDVWTGLPLRLLCVYLASLLATMALQQIPVIRRIVE